MASQSASKSVDSDMFPMGYDERSNAVGENLRYLDLAALSKVISDCITFSDLLNKI
jgi:hypothetical protein